MIGLGDAAEYRLPETCAVELAARLNATWLSTTAVWPEAPDRHGPVFEDAELGSSRRTLRHGPEP